MFRPGSPVPSKADSNYLGGLTGLRALFRRQLAELLELLSRWEGEVLLFVTAIGGQGHIFGRGNQQFSPDVLRAVGLENIRVVAAKSKISALEGRPLLVDTNDPDLDSELSGYKAITTGYDDQVMYRINRA